MTLTDKDYIEIGKLVVESGLITISDDKSKCYVNLPDTMIESYETAKRIAKLASMRAKQNCPWV